MTRQSPRSILGQYSTILMPPDRITQTLNLILATRNSIYPTSGPVPYHRIRWVVLGPTTGYWTH